jgi:hypothetical protein
MPNNKNTPGDARSMEMTVWDKALLHALSFSNLLRGLPCATRLHFGPHPDTLLFFIVTLGPRFAK